MSCHLRTPGWIVLIFSRFVIKGWGWKFYLSFTCGIIMKNHKLYIFVILIHAILGDEIEEEKDLWVYLQHSTVLILLSDLSSKPEGRQFFVTTTTSTTTLSTIKFCWVQTATATNIYRCKRDASVMKYVDQNSKPTLSLNISYSALLMRRPLTYLKIWRSVPTRPSTK